MMRQMEVAMEPVDPREFVDSMLELYDEYIDLRRKAGDRSLTGLPDLLAAIRHVEQHGITQCDRPTEYVATWAAKE